MKKQFFCVSVCLCLVILLLGSSVAGASLGSRTLSQGARGDDVAELQRMLNNLGFGAGPVDGIFGPLTRNGVVNFQRARGLAVDGIVGPQTFGALNVRPDYSRSSSSNRLSTSEVDILARLVRAEAGGEAYIGQVAVAATVLNRVSSPSYPNTVRGVVYQVYNGYIQYCPVRNGTINLPANPTAYRAVQDALNGWDPSRGALSFYNPRTATNAWIRSRPVTTVIGNHVFAR